MNIIGKPAIFSSCGLRLKIDWVRKEIQFLDPSEPRGVLYNTFLFAIPRCHKRPLIEEGTDPPKFSMDWCSSPFISFPYHTPTLGSLPFSDFGECLSPFKGGFSLCIYGRPPPIDFLIYGNIFSRSIVNEWELPHPSKSWIWGDFSCDFWHSFEINLKLISRTYTN